MVSTTTQEVIEKNSRLKVYETLEIKRRYSAGYEADWFDISNYMLFANAPEVEKKLDFDSYGYGQFKGGTASFLLDNTQGTFNNEISLYSLFTGTLTRHYTKIRYKAGYRDESGTKIDELVFEGLINGKSLSNNFEDGEMSIEALSYDTILAERTVPLSSLKYEILGRSGIGTGSVFATNGSTTLTSITFSFLTHFSEGLEIDIDGTTYIVDTITSAFICDLTEVYAGSTGAVGTISSYSGFYADALIETVLDYDTVINSYLGVVGANINAATNIGIDNTRPYENKKVDEFLTEIAQKTSSAWYIDSDLDIIFRSKDINAGDAFEFIGGYSGRKGVNIISIEFEDGFGDIINQVNYESGDNKYVYSDAEYKLEKYGVNQLDLSGADITNTATISTLSTQIVSDNSTPKIKLVVRTVYMPNVIGFFDTCTVDYRPKVTSQGKDLLVFNDDVSTFNEDYYFGKYINRIIIEDSLIFKYYGYKHNIADGYTDHYLVEA